MRTSTDTDITRWLDGTVPLNPMAEKLQLIKSLGYLPNSIRWAGFKICEERAIIITPSGREFSPKELESFENLMPFRGGHRMKAAEWKPSKLK